jgi:GDP-L-fucose synthase
MRVLLTGGTGFVGRNLHEGLRKSFEVLAPGRKELDLLDAAAVRRYLARSPVDAVVHAATIPGHRNASPARDLGLGNIRMFVHLVLAAAASTRFVVLGSGAEYDVSRDIVKARENDPSHPVPADETGFSKLAQSAFAEGRPGFVHLRPFGVYGPREDWEIRFVSNALCKALHGLPITLRQNRRLDYVWVEDLCEVVARFLLRGPGAHTTYNVTPDETPDLLSLAHLAREVAGADVPILVARDGTGLEYTGDNGRLHREFPDLTFTPPREGMERLCSFYRARLGEISRERLLIDK